MSILQRGVWLAAGVLALGSAPWFELHGDVLRLANGNEIEGRVAHLPDGNYEVLIEPGRIVQVSARDVTERVAREAPIDEFERRAQALGASDRDGWLELATWADRKRLRGSGLRAYRSLLGIDPHHSVARDRLGYVLYRNRWVRRSTLEDEGLVRFRGLWMLPAEVEAIRTQEAEEEFRALLSEARHENRYLRENALLRLGESREARLIPYLVRLSESPTALERLVAARVLANHGFDDGAVALYRALRVEPQDPVRTAQIAALRSFRDRRLGDWLARDLVEPAPLGARELQNLLALAEACPLKTVVPALIDCLEHAHDPDAVQATLRRLLGGPHQTSDEWRQLWRDRSAHVAEDLGVDWL